MCSHLLKKIVAFQNQSQDKIDCSRNPVLLETFPKPVKDTFRLPMEYLEETDIHPVSPEVCADLELLQNNTLLQKDKDETNKEDDDKKDNDEETKPLVHYLYEPKGPFSQAVLPKLAGTFTSNRDFLKDTQQVILCRNDVFLYDTTQEEEQKVLNIWNDLVYNPEFLEKYGYLEWDAVKHLNRSSAFLQSLSILNGVVPMFNLMFSILIAILPFFILFYSGNSISLTSYTECLRQIGGNNQMFCKMVSMLDPENFNPQNAVVFLLMLALYSYQIYQNIVHTERFYQHLLEVSNNLITIKSFVKDSQQRFKTFVKNKPENAPTYNLFYMNVENHIHQCNKLSKTLEGVKDPADSSMFHQFTNMGEYFRLYYHLYDNEEAQQTILFCMNMNGYLDLLDATARHLRLGNVHLADFTIPTEEETEEETDVEETDVEETEEETQSVLRICINKSPSLSVFIGDKDNCCNAPEKCKGVKDKIKKRVSNAIKGMYYPSLVGKQGIVKNDVELNQHTILTGPNASGKTTFLKAIAINTLLSQQVGLGFYDEYRLVEPYRHIHSYLNIPDTSERDSLFEAETRRCKTILEKITNSSTTDNHLCIFDELFSGTNPVDASRSAYSFLKHLCNHYPQVDFVLTTHYTDICRKIEEEPTSTTEGGSIRKMVNQQMNVLENKDHSLTMTYKMISGISDVKGASHILENMGFPDEIVQEVREGHSKKVSV